MTQRSKFDRITPHPDDPRQWGAKCDQCPLNGARPVFGDGNPDAQFAFVGEAPGREEEKAGVPFIGRSGELFEAYLGKHGLQRTDVWIDNAICCCPPGGDLKGYLQNFKKQAKKAGIEFLHPVEACRPRLFTALKVPRCKKCSRYARGPDALVCRCEKPMFVALNPWGDWLKSHRPKQLEKKPLTYPVATGLMGNFAMLAVLGFEGITAHHSYVENMVERRERLKAFVKEVHAGEKDTK